jgi:hypothetical protein
MTWTYRRRENPGSEVSADYECPIHGRFTRAVVRDENGDPPQVVRCKCPATGAEEWGMCGMPAAWRPSAPGAVHIRRAELVRGGGSERPPDRHVMDTRPLADGMPLDEFKARRAAVHRDEALRRVRHAFGRTGKVYR